MQTIIQKQGGGKMSSSISSQTLPILETYPKVTSSSQIHSKETHNSLVQPTITSQTHSKLNPKLLDTLDSKSLVKLTSPLKIDSKRMFKSLDSNLTSKLLDSKFNPKVLVKPNANLNSQLTSTLQTHSQPTPKLVNPKFLSLVCAGVLLTIPHSISAKDNWTLLGTPGLDTTDANTNKLTQSLTNKQISASQNKAYKNLEITNSGSITNTNTNYAITIGNNATIESIIGGSFISKCKF